MVVMVNALVTARGESRGGGSGGFGGGEAWVTDLNGGGVEGGLVEGFRCRFGGGSDS